MPGTSISHRHEVTSSWSDPVPGSSDAGGDDVDAVGQQRADGAAPARPGSTGSSSAMSRYSATDSHPVGRARPKLSLGRGVNPAV